MGDIGTHAAHLLRFLTEKNLEAVAADLNTFGADRQLDDDGSVLLRYEEGIRGYLSASQVSTGEENDLRVRISGTQASLEWCHADPNTLWFKPLEGPVQKLRAGQPYLSQAAQTHTRLPAGHPEGFIEAFANLYRNLALDIQQRGGKPSGFNAQWHDYPNVLDGRFGMAFVEAVVASSQANSAWTPLKYSI
jgi:predicted dehydrogenase